MEGSRKLTKQWLYNICSGTGEIKRNLKCSTRPPPYQSKGAGFVSDTVAALSLFTLVAFGCFFLQTITRIRMTMNTATVTATAPPIAPESTETYSAVGGGGAGVGVLRKQE